MSGELVTATVELFYSGVWNDISADVRTTAPINIDRGVANQADGGVADPAGLTLVLNNGLSKVNTSVSNRYSPRNPMSDLFGLIGANTPIRVSAGLVGDTPTVRTVQEVVSWPPRSDVSQNDRWVPVEAAGILRRLGAQSSPLRSAIRRFVEGQSVDPTGYWTLEDPQGAQSAVATVGGTRLVRDSPGQGAQFGQGFLAPWLPAAMLGGNIDDGQMAGRVAGAAGGFTVDFAFRAPDPGGWGDEEPQFWWVGVVGDDRTYRVLVAPDLSDLEMQVSLNVSPFTTFGIISGDFGDLLDGQLHHIRMRVTEAAGDDVTLTGWIDGNTIASGTVDIGTASIGAVEVIGFGWFQTAPWTLPVNVGHLALWGPTSPTTATAARYYSGHVGELTARRAERLCDEHGVSFTSTGDRDASAPMGPQYPGTFLEVLGECAKVEAAGSRAPILVEQRAALGLHFNTLASLYLPRTAGLTLDFTEGQLSPPVDPTPDDLGMTNDATAERRDGGQARAQVSGGPRGITAAGRVDRDETFDVLSNANLPDIAGWWVHHGTWDEDRYPMLRTNLRSLSTRTDGSALVAAVQTLDPGGLVVIQNTPLWISAEDVYQLVLGLTESIHTDEWLIDAHTTPALPFAVPTVEDDEGYQILGSDSAVTAEALDSSETGVDINCGAGPDWVYETDFDVIVGGERMTVTAVAAMAGTFPARTTTLTVTRSVNGIVKSHATGAAVEFFRKAYVGAWG